MDIARVVATRATCDRKHVGAVLVRGRTILSTGYNGSIRGMPHCSEVGHMMEDGHCVATLHAEANAILQAACNGTRIEGCDIYTTASPCWPCFKLIGNAGMKRVVFGEFYRDERIFEVAKTLGIELVGLDSARGDPGCSLSPVCVGGAACTTSRHSSRCARLPAHRWRGRRGSRWPGSRRRCRCSLALEMAGSVFPEG